MWAINIVFYWFDHFYRSLGLFGLAAYSTEKRAKEIDIRKVNGARTWKIMLMLSKNFTKGVANAFVVECPIAYYATNKWLQNFAYKTTENRWIYIGAGLISFLIAFITVSWKVANKNPVEALRYK